MPALHKFLADKHDARDLALVFALSAPFPGLNPLFQKVGVLCLSERLVRWKTADFWLPEASVRLVVR